MRIVQTYDPEPFLYPGDRTWPTRALIEDDAGFRWLLTSVDGIPELYVRRAVADGAAAVLIPDGRDWLAATVTPYLAAAQAAADPILAVGVPFHDIPDLLDLQDRERQHQAPPPPAAPTSRFVNLHTHSEYSPLDGLSRLDDLAQAAAEAGQGALGLTDHGYVTGHPDLQAAAERHGITPVFGMEAYLVDDVADRGDQYDYWHLILLARDDEGLRNLWALSTAAWRDGFYGKPRMDWRMLAQHVPGLIATTACLGGPLSKALLADDRQTASARLARLQEIFGPDVYAEIQPFPHPDQIKVNTALVELSEQHGVPLIAAADSHYTRRADHERHQVWLACATSKNVGETGMFTEGAFHLHAEDEMRAALDYLPSRAVEQALYASRAVADSCTARIRTSKTIPLSGPRATHDGDAAALRELAVAGWSKLPAGAHGDQREYVARFEREMELLESQKFCGYYMIVSDYCRWAKANNILVGPGRGSGGASLVAYLTGITEIDPVKHDLPFERFLTPGRVSMPDFDVDFPASKRAEIHAYLRSRWGQDHVVSIGNIQRLKNKAVVRDLERALRPRLPATAFNDIAAMSALVEEAEAGTAGLGLSWADLWAQHGDRLNPLRAKYPELFDHADHLVGLVRTYGKHAAGVVISTGDPLTGTLPLRGGGEEGGQMVTQFDDDGVEALGYVKFDILTLRTLDTVQHALDTIQARYGRRLDLYGFSRELDDPMVWELIGSGKVLGCFQIETPLGAAMVRRMRPTTLAELADAITLVRPGPRNAGLTAAYLARMEGTQSVAIPDERLAEVLRPTWGVIIYQEQVLAACRIIAGYDDAEADDIRKILGKKQVDKIDAAGRDFVARAIERGMPRNDAMALWEQMAEFSKYAFGKAHAYAYALLTWWTAFLKTHYPVEFFAAALSTVDKDRIPAFVKDARRNGVAVLPPDINVSGLGFTADGASVRYGLDSLKGIGGKAAADLIAQAPYTSVADLTERTGSAVNAATVRLLARAGAFDSLPGEPHRAALVTALDPDLIKAAKQCVDRLPDDAVPEDALPCRFDWASEEPPVSPKTGKKLKAKPAPRRCTAACRQYRPAGTVDVSLIAPYTPVQVGRIEQDLLGVSLSWTPFDQIADQAVREEFRASADAAEASTGGDYMLLALVEEIREYRAPNGLVMGFVNLDTEGPTLKTACMSTLWAKLDPAALDKALVVAKVRRTEKGLTLLEIGPLTMRTAP